MHTSLKWEFRGSEKQSVVGQGPHSDKHCCCILLQTVRNWPSKEQHSSFGGISYNNTPHGQGESCDTVFHLHDGGQLSNLLQFHQNARWTQASNREFWGSDNQPAAGQGPHSDKYLVALSCCTQRETDHQKSSTVALVASAISMLPMGRVKLTIKRAAQYFWWHHLYLCSSGSRFRRLLFKSRWVMRISGKALACYGKMCLLFCLFHLKRVPPY